MLHLIPIAENEPTAILKKHYMTELDYCCTKCLLYPVIVTEPFLTDIEWKQLDKRMYREFMILYWWYIDCLVSDTRLKSVHVSALL